MSRLSQRCFALTIVCQQIALGLCGSAAADTGVFGSDGTTSEISSGFNDSRDEFSATDGAGADTHKASVFVRAKQEELQGALKASKAPKTDPKLLSIFDAMLDYDALTRDALGSEWEPLTAEQRAEFAVILKQLIQKSYRKNLSDTSGYEVQYTGVDEGADGVVVKTLAQNKVNKREKPLGINYVVSTTPQGLKVRDVVTDEVSLVGNYRTQFKRIIKKKGFAGLVEQMRKQLDK